MHAILFIVYFFLLCFAIKKLRFFRNSEIRISFLLFFFGLRVIVSCIHVWVAYRYFSYHGEIWQYFQEGLLMKGELLRNPSHFLETLLPPLDKFSFFDTRSPWFALEFKFVSGINTLFDFFSFNNFYINSLLFSFFTFAGGIALFRVFKEIFHNNGLLCALLALIIPSTLFWTSCINKEGLIYLSLGFFHFLLHRVLTEKLHFQTILACVLFLLIGIFCRMYLLFGLLPSVIFWIAGEKIFLRIPVMAFLTIASMAFLYYFVSTFYPNADLFLIISERQQEFLEQSGNSRIFLPVLQPNLTSFLNVLPTALLNGFAEPLPGKGGQSIYLLMSLEIMLICAIIAFAISRRFFKTPKVKMGVYDLSCLFMAIPCMLLIGYTVPFVGEIVRYRSIYLPFLLVPFIHTLSGIPLMGRINRSLGKMIA